MVFLMLLLMDNQKEDDEQQDDDDGITDDSNNAVDDDEEYVGDKDGFDLVVNTCVIMMTDMTESVPKTTARDMMMSGLYA